MTEATERETLFSLSDVSSVQDLGPLGQQIDLALQSGPVGIDLTEPPFVSFAVVQLLLATVQRAEARDQSVTLIVPEASPYTAMIETCRLTPWLD